MLVSVADLQNYMDIEFTSKQVNGVELILAGLQTELEFILRRPIEVESFLDVHHVGAPYQDAPLAAVVGGDIGEWSNPPYTVYFENTPVISIQGASVTPAGGVKTAMVVGSDYDVLDFGIDVHSVSPYDKVEIAYTAGIENEKELDFFRLAILRAAAREAQNLHDDTKGVQNLETRNVAPLVVGFTEEEKRTIKRRKRYRF